MKAAAKSPQGPTLYEIGNQYREIAEQAAACDGELTPELAQAIEALELAEGEKLDSYASLAKDAKARAAAIKAYEIQLTAERIAPLTRKRKALEALYERLTDRVATYMREKDVRELGGRIWRFAFASNGKPSLVWKIAEVTPAAAWEAFAAAHPEAVGDVASIDYRVERFTKRVIDEAAVRAGVEAKDPDALVLAELVTGQHVRLY